jgi:hypothetical protein
MIVFENPGLLEIRAITVFGWHAKVVSNPIGSFGTGNRYAIAVLLRTGHKVTLWRGLDHYEFSTKTVDARGGKEFNLVMMTGPDGTVEMPYTTHLGKNWDTWMAFRELHSNVLDEKGTTYQATSFTPRAGHTAFVVEGNEIEQAYSERATIFLDTPVLASSDGIARHNGTSNYVYYRGVRVHKLEHPSIYTYNLLSHQDLTEDRTLKDQSSPAYKLAAHIAHSGDEDYLRSVLIAEKNTFECEIPCYSFDPSEAVVRVYTELRKAGHMAKMTFFATNLFSGGKRALPLPDPIELNAVQKKQLARAIEFCNKAGWPVQDYPIVVVPYATDGVLALAEAGQIILTQECFDLGIKTIVHALYEEYLHLKHGFKDHSREFQSFLFKQVIGAQEQILVEAL